jgi:Flp pilus assembly pilin Flp
MSDHSLTRAPAPQDQQPPSKTKTRGQALIEYVLILTLVVVALIAVLTLTGPVVGNVFSNTVYELMGGDVEPRDTLSAERFWQQVEAVSSFTPGSPKIQTNTPAPPTSTPNH